MKNLMHTFVAGVVLALCVCGVAVAESLNEPFSKERFEALQKSNALILVDIYAPWCPTCAAQQEVLDAYQAEHVNANLHRLKVDFDDDKQWVKAFHAPRQATLVLYRGDKQVWFSVAETRREKIFEALDGAAGITP